MHTSRTSMENIGFYKMFSWEWNGKERRLEKENNTCVSRTQQCHDLAVVLATPTVTWPSCCPGHTHSHISVWLNRVTSRCPGSIQFPVLLLVHPLSHSPRNWTTPVTVDLKTGAVSLIKQADRLGSRFFSKLCTSLLSVCLLYVCLSVCLFVCLFVCFLFFCCSMSWVYVDFNER